MKQYRIYFTDFWNGFNPELHNMGPVMKKVFPNSIFINEPEDVDICVYSVFGNQNHKNIDARYKISYQGEPIDTTFGHADLAIGFKANNASEFRFPLWHFNLHEDTGYDESKLLKYLEPRKPKWDDLQNYNVHPISAVYTNKAGLRKTTMPILINNNLCASYGRLYRTHTHHIDDKKEIIKKHPFHISFESMIKEGYVTEKLRDALINDSLPFYWGCSKWVKEDFNPEAFFDISNFSEEESLKACHAMVDVMNNKQYCESMRKAPIFKTAPTLLPLYDAIRNVVQGYDV